MLFVSLAVAAGSREQNPFWCIGGSNEQSSLYRIGGLPSAVRGRDRSRAKFEFRDLRGTATDLSGALLPDVTVTVLNNDTGVSRVFVTNSDGLYDTNSILPGTYTITFSKTGFQKLVKNSITLQVGIVTVDGALQVGSVSQEVVVTSSLPLLKTEDATVATTFSTEQLTDLPSKDPTNGWTSLLQQLPGATSTPMGGNGGGQADQPRPRSSRRRKHALLLQLSG